VRNPAVAGRFYPGDAAALGRLVDDLMAAVPVADGGPDPVGYVVPHAGYRYSGATAAFAYARMRRHAERVRRVVVLGPAHYVPVRGCVVPAVDAWSTPLGAVPIDGATAAALVDGGHARADDEPFAPEHSLEVQLPFLQRVLPEPVPVLPIAVGPSTVDDVAATIHAATGGPGTVVLCSTDLSHYLTAAQAEERDAGTAAAMLALAPERIGTGDACGVYALRGVLGHARAAGLRPELLHRCTSADASGDTSRVVGYAAMSFIYD
jgi:AmmeMemoRadiSam system protein B